MAKNKSGSGTWHLVPPKLSDIVRLNNIFGQLLTGNYTDQVRLNIRWPAHFVAETIIDAKYWKLSGSLTYRFYHLFKTLVLPSQILSKIGIWRTLLIKRRRCPLLVKFIISISQKIGGDFQNCCNFFVLNHRTWKLVCIQFGPGSLFSDLNFEIIKIGSHTISFSKCG